MSYVITDYHESTRPLVAIFQTKSGYVAEPIIGVGVYRDMSPAQRGSENIISPLYASDLLDLQSHEHDARWQVEESHLPQFVVQDEGLYAAVLLGNVPVEQDEAGVWTVSE